MVECLIHDADGMFIRRPYSGLKPFSNYVERFYDDIKRQMKGSKSACNIPKYLLNEPKRLAGKLTFIIPGAKEYFGKVKKDGYSLSIATSASMPTIESILEKNGIRGLFDPVVTSRDVLNLKPDPECLYVVLDKTGAKIEDCALVTDSISDVKMAKKIGMNSIRVGWGIDGFSPIGNEVVAKDFDDLYKKIKAL
jgi:HAD superfamily hydrolase (TIGR01509 family)